jgi:hypothetical protein
MTLLLSTPNFLIMKTISQIFTLLLLPVLYSSCQQDHLVPDGLQVVSLTDQIDGKGYNELTQEISKWTLEKPIDKSPANDPDGALHDASLQPLSGVMLLEGNFGGESTRSLTIPAGRYVFVPVFLTTTWYYENDKCDPTFQPGLGQSLEEFLLSLTVDIMDGATNMSMKLDGKEIVADLKQYRVKTKAFSFMPDKDFNNPNCDYSQQKATGVSDGYALFLKLPKGKHTLTYQGDIPGTDPFHEEIAWNLTVE